MTDHWHSKAKENFGLIPRAYPSDETLEDVESKTPWQRFEHYVKTLNGNAEEGTEYKVLYLGRHGQGYHNVAESRYGTKLWDVSSACSNLKLTLPSPSPLQFPLGLRYYAEMVSQNRTTGPVKKATNTQIGQTPISPPSANNKP